MKDGVLDGLSATRKPFGNRDINASRGLGALALIARPSLWVPPLRGVELMSEAWKPEEDLNRLSQNCGFALRFVENSGVSCGVSRFAILGQDQTRCDV